MVGRRGAWVIGGVLAVGFFLILFVVWAGGAGGGRGDGFGLGRKVGLLEIEGPIQSSASAVRQIRYYARDRAVAAVVVRVNSPGGEVGASQEIHAELLRLRREGGKKVVASLGGVAASGGYYVAVAADTIVANPGTLTGSIGVILELYSVQSLLRKLGVDVAVIKSGRFKDTGSPLHPLLPEEREVLQAVTDDTHGQFVDAVAAGRRLDREKVLGLADGRVFTGRQALRLGLVDILGTYEDAIAVAGEMTGLGRHPGTVKGGVPGRWESLLNRLDSELSTLFLQRISVRYAVQ